MITPNRGGSIYPLCEASRGEGIRESSFHGWMKRCHAVSHHKGEQRSVGVPTNLVDSVCAAVLRK
jgi:hypothetical protein